MIVHYGWLITAVASTMRAQFHTQWRIKHFEPKQEDSCKKCSTRKADMVNIAFRVLQSLICSEKLSVSLFR